MGMSSASELTRDDFDEMSPSPRLAIGLCLDVSSSMKLGGAIDELNKGVAGFYKAVGADVTARNSAEVGVIAFAGDVAVLRDFQPFPLKPNPPQLSVLEQGRLRDGTNLGRAVNEVVKRLQKRTSEYRAEGKPYYQPWLVVLTDGRPNVKVTQPTDDHRAAADRVRTLERTRKLVVMPIAAGTEADTDVLALFTGVRRPARVADGRFEELFLWLSQSVIRVSTSQVGDDVVLPGTEPWRVIEPKEEENDWVVVTS